MQQRLSELTEQMKRLEEHSEVLIYCRQLMLGALRGLPVSHQVAALERSHAPRAAAVMRSTTTCDLEMSIKAAISSGDLGDDLLQNRTLTAQVVSLLAKTTLQGRIPF